MIKENEINLRVTEEEGEALKMLQDMLHQALQDDKASLEYCGVLYVGLVGAISSLQITSDIPENTRSIFLAFTDYAGRIKDKFPATIDQFN